LISSQRLIALGNPDVLGLPAFGALHNIELNRLTFLKRTKPFTLDG
jgi:hypothetical protein